MTFRLAADAKAAQGAEAADFRQWAVGSFIAIARASGWLEPCSSAAARRSAVCSSTPAKVFTATTCGLPSVRVPVLSKTVVSSSLARCSASASRTSTPYSAARPTPEIIDIGVAVPKAHGQAIISTVVAMTVV